jgi:dihydroorotate dehydrogenase
VPDWTYHPFFKPLLFRMPAEEGRRLTLRLLEIQARTALGRRVFRLFGHGLPPPALALDLFGVRFPGPIGLGPGIDVEAGAASVMQYLGFGFLMVGPVGAQAVPRRFAHDPRRVRDVHGLASSALAGAPSAAEAAARLRALPALQVPVGMAIRGPDYAEALRAAGDAPAFFTLPPTAMEGADGSGANGPAELVAAAKRPLLLRLSPAWDSEREAMLVERALEAGMAGCVVSAGAPFPCLPEGDLSAPHMLPQTRRAIERIRRRFGDALPIVAAGGITTPEAALRCLDAGASLVELYEGLIYAGPGLPGRIVHALEARASAPPARSSPGSSAPLSSSSLSAYAPLSTATVNVPAGRTPSAEAAARAGAALAAVTGAVLIGSGLFAMVLAATVKLMPYDVAYLGIGVDELCARGQCRIVHFMAHDRVSFGGSIMSIGALYLWLAAVPLRQGRAWAWWTLALSGAVGFASFLTYLGYGYLDVWHGRATLALLPVFIGGLALGWKGLRGPRGPGVLLRSGARAWTWSRAGLGRACLGFSAAGMILGGLTIMVVGMTRVFVPQDLEYMQLSVAELQAISPRLVPLIAHDRAGFGGGLFSGGLTVLFCLWCGIRPGARGLWWALLASGSIGFATAIGIHPLVGYTSFVHLLPAYAGALAFSVAMWLLHRPMCRVDGAASEDDGVARFPDLG